MDLAKCRDKGRAHRRSDASAPSKEAYDPRQGDLF